MHDRLRKAFGLILYLLAGAIFTVLMFSLRFWVTPNHFSDDQLEDLIIGVLIVVVILTAIFFDELRPTKSDEE